MNYKIKIAFRDSFVNDFLEVTRINREFVLPVLTVSMMSGRGLETFSSLCRYKQLEAWKIPADTVYYRRFFDSCIVELTLSYTVRYLCLVSRGSLVRFEGRFDIYRSLLGDVIRELSKLNREA